MVTPANNENLEAWEEELQKGLEVIEALEYAVKRAKVLNYAQEGWKTIQIAIDDIEIAVSRTALRVGRLRRASENEGEL